MLGIHVRQFQAIETVARNAGVVACTGQLPGGRRSVRRPEIADLAVEGDCAQVTWKLLAHSIPEWSAVAFAGFLLLGVFLTLRHRW